MEMKYIYPKKCGGGGHDEVWSIAVYKLIIVHIPMNTSNTVYINTLTWQCFYASIPLVNKSLSVLSLVHPAKKGMWMNIPVALYMY